MGHCGEHDFFFLFLSLFFVCTAIPEKPPEENNRSEKREGRESKRRQVRTRSTMLEEHTKLSCKGGH